MSEATTEKGLVVFQDLKVPTTLQAKILERDPEFADRPSEDQIELIQFMLEQALKTTEGVRSRFPMIKVKHGGTKAFELPKSVGDEDGELVREFDGTILDQYLTKSYWVDEDNVGGKPDCASLDGLEPYTKNPVMAPKDGGCIACPHNKWGSATKGAGKRCRDAKRLILDVDGHEMPVRLQLSVMNIKVLDAYLSELRDQGAPIGTVVTRFKAIEARNAGGTEYTGVELSTVREIPFGEVLQLRRTMIRPFEADFRQGFIEGGEGGDSSEGAPANTGPRSQRAADVM